MRNNRLFVCLGLVMTLVLVGCATSPERILSKQAARYATLPNGFDPLNPEQPTTIFGAAAMKSGKNLVRLLEKKHGRPLNLISISGGGQNGAFGAGFLIGWRESGQRPVFDVVSGVSTGALLGTHALLGTPADDAKLEQMYTQITKDDIYQSRRVVNILAGADSLRDTAPLRALIAKFITAKTLERVAAAYDEGRLLVVGTTNIDYGQTWVWNMSLIAKDGNLEIYRKVLLASASFPIVFPPVEIDGHLFIDGAARSNIVIPGMAATTRPDPPLYGPGNLFLINNGRLNHPPAALRRALGDVAATTVSVMMDQSMQTALTRSYFGTKFLGYKFNMAAIPDDIKIGKDPLAFDPKKMRAAFEAGRAMAKQVDPWEKAPTNFGDIPDWAMDAVKECR